jgi:sec-independent protein translocase protein TatA/sec-independent protein translocase protein TatB
MFGFGMSEVILLLALALILIGPKKLPEVAKGMGKGYAEFRKYMNELKEAVNVDFDEEPKQKKTPAQDLYANHYKDIMKEPEEVNNVQEENSEGKKSDES